MQVTLAIMQKIAIDKKSLSSLSQKAISVSLKKPIAFIANVIDEMIKEIKVAVVIVNPLPCRTSTGIFV